MKIKRRASDPKSKKFRVAREDWAIGNNDVDVYFRNVKSGLRLLMEPAEARALANHLIKNAQDVEVARTAKKLAAKKVELEEKKKKKKKSKSNDSPTKKKKIKKKTKSRS